LFSASEYPKEGLSAAFMAKLTTQQIREVAIEVIAEHPEGIRLIDLARGVSALHPETPYATVFTQCAELPRREALRVSRPSRGVLKLKVS